ncbi:MAG: GNAT family N-acetyltransferase [Planctomycetia bacterium]|nr:GNAT family N-acetyltransferase [Planctomycetia bacterium]
MKIPAPPCLLRPWRHSDLASLVRCANNRNVWINLRNRMPFPYTEADGKAWIECASSENPLCNFAIEFEQHAIGSMGLCLQNDIETGTAEIGYWLAEPFWGKGLATSCVKAFAQWAFAQFPLRKLYAGVMANNHPSRRVLEKAGFKLEGIHRQHVIKAGTVQDQAFYGLLKTDSSAA